MSLIPLEMKNPYVSIGLPVYNGENFIRSAIESILAQTYTDFEIIISDNASTDNTEKVCREYLASDSRIRFYRQYENLGAAPNFNYLFTLARGKYFKWFAHDDICEPCFLEEMINVLDHDNDIVLCHSRVKIIDSSGKLLSEKDPLYSWVSSNALTFPIDSQKAHERLKNAIAPHPCYQVFGLIRADSLRETSLIANYSGSDRLLLAQLSLQGSFFEHPEKLMSLRRHTQQSIHLLETSKSAHRYSEWFDTSTKGKLVFPRWNFLHDLYLCIYQCKHLGFFGKLNCYIATYHWLRRTRKGLIEDISVFVVFYMKSVSRVFHQYSKF